jgi:hypothetical protein
MAHVLAYESEQVGTYVRILYFMWLIWSHFWRSCIQRMISLLSKL